MAIDDSAWSYNEFLAFLLIYGAETKPNITTEEMEFIQARTGISDLARIKEKVDSVSDAEALEIIEDYRKGFLSAPDAKQKVYQQLEDLLKLERKHTQIESVLIHFLERLI